MLIGYETPLPSSDWHYLPQICQIVRWWVVAPLSHDAGGGGVLNWGWRGAEAPVLDWGIFLRLWMGVLGVVCFTPFSPSERPAG